MMLAEGDVLQYEAIKNGTVGGYLNKLNNYVEGIEREIARSKHQQASARR